MLLMPPNSSRALSSARHQAIKLAGAERQGGGIWSVRTALELVMDAPELLTVTEYVTRLRQLHIGQKERTVCRSRNVVRAESPLVSQGLGAPRQDGQRRRLANIGGRIHGLAENGEFLALAVVAAIINGLNFSRRQSAAVNGKLINQAIETA